MTSKDIREKFLKFFESKGHTVVESDLLVPKNDATLLFTGAGMNQFKEQFMGKNLIYTKATSSQKCIRTGDLENVGRTSSHQTFFEMLGNFSFGDYFKEDACKWAWEFLTEVLEISSDKLWISVYQDDAQSYDIWKNIVGIDPAKIVKMGAQDNFWPSNAPLEGPNGPCGPCSEIYYDTGIECAKDGCSPACNCKRFVEVWNLVFTQFNRVGENDLKPLPSKNIDTGMGLERITAVMQGAKTNFDTDLFVGIIDKIKELTDVKEEFKLKAIADHIRTATFAIGDGIAPANEDRGYVIRKLIRRAYLFGNKQEPFLYKVVPVIIEIMKSAYPNLESSKENIMFVIEEEEQRFQSTLVTGLPKLQEIFDISKNIICGDDIFKLVDTFGLPLDVIAEKAKEKSLELDVVGFEKCMEQRKLLSRQGSKIESNIFTEDIFAQAPEPEVCQQDEIPVVISFITKEAKRISFAKEGDNVVILTSPQCAAFYKEGGGQVGDAGVMLSDKTQIEILNTLLVEGRIVHSVLIKKGNVAIGDSFTIALNKKRNADIAKNHTATHILQSALRTVLGDQVKQSGSYVDDKRLRFDFTFTKKLTDEQLEKVEDFVNGCVSKAVEVKKEVKIKEEAQKEGAIALFGEKYADQVRVVTVAGYSKEFCGGSHIENTADIGLFKIISESSIASGIRRIEAVTSTHVISLLYKDMQRASEEINSLYSDVKEIDEATIKYDEVKKVLPKEQSLECSVDWQYVKKFYYNDKKVIDDVLVFFAKQKKKLAKKQKASKLEGVNDLLKELKGSALDINGTSIICSFLKDKEMNYLRMVADKIRETCSNLVAILFSESNGKVSFIVTYTSDIANKGIDANAVIKAASSAIGGSGGGRIDFAQAGGNNSSGIEQALELAKKKVMEYLNN